MNQLVFGGQIPKFRVYALARDLDITNKYLLGILDDLNELALNHVSILDHEKAELVKKLYPYQQSYKPRFLNKSDHNSRKTQKGSIGYKN